MPETTKELKFGKIYKTRKDIGHRILHTIPLQKTFNGGLYYIEAYVIEQDRIATYPSEWYLYTYYELVEE